MKKINCGGFYIDEDTLELEDNVLSVKNGGGGGGSGGVLFINASLTEEVDENEMIKITFDKPIAKILETVGNGILPVIIDWNETVYRLVKYSVEEGDVYLYFDGDYTYERTSNGINITKDVIFVMADDLEYGRFYTEEVYNDSPSPA